MSPPPGGSPAPAGETRQTATEPPKLRERWECGECGVVVRNVAGHRIPRPSGWDGGRCVPCRREHARRVGGNEGVCRDELRRGTPFARAAKLAHLARPKAKEIYEQLVGRGEIDRAPFDKAGRAPSGGRGRATFQDEPELEEALRADPGRTDKEIATELDCDARKVRRRRAHLGLPPAPTELERDAAALRGIEGETTIQGFADAVGASRARAGKRLEALVKAGLAEGRTEVTDRHRKLYRPVTPPGPPG